jgi:hypothetical protein
MTMIDSALFHRHSCILAAMTGSLTLGSAVLAAEPGAPAPATATEAPSTPSAPVVAPAPVADDRAAAVLDELAAHAGAQRRVGSVALLGVGAVSVGAGLLSEHEYDSSFGKALWIGGASAMGLGLLGLLFSGEMERFAAEQAALGPGQTPEALESAWRQRAEAARSKRKRGAVFNLCIGAAGIGTGVALAAGVGDLSKEDKADWVTLALVGGGAFVASGSAALVLKSEMEKGFELAYPTAARSPSARLEVGPLALPSGGGLQAFGSF